MSNKTIKNLIYIFIVLVIIPVGRVNASSEPKVTEDIHSSSTNIQTASSIIEPDIVIQKEVNLPKELKSTKNISINSSTPVVASGKQYTTEEIKAKICAAFGSQCANALIIAEKESGFRANAISKTNDYGVFQLNCRWQSRRVGGNCNLFLDVDVNIKIAKQTYDEQGWSPWTTKIFLPK